MEPNTSGPSNLQLSAIIEASHDAIIGKNLDGDIIYWNKGAEKMFGYSKAEIIGKSISTIIPPELQGELQIILGKVKKGEVVVDYDTVRLRKDGSRINVALSVTPIRSEKDSIIGVTSVERDITERKKMEDKLRQTQLIVDNSQDAIYAGSLEGIIYSWNKGAEKMFGYSAQEVIGKPYVMLVAPENRVDLQVLTDKLSRNESISGVEISGVRKDGTRIEVSVSASPILIDGKMTSVSVVVRDITDRKKTEKDLIKLKKAVDASGEAIFMTDKEGVIAFINPGFTNLYGYNADEVINKVTPRILKSGLTKPEVYQSFWKKILSKQIIRQKWTNKTKTGSLVFIDESINPILGEKGEITGFMAIHLDITEREKSEQRIKELNEVRNKFIEIISHQLRTPLTAINWNLESLLKGDFGKLEPTQDKFLQVTHKASTTLASRMHDLLTAMDIEEGRVTFTKEKFALDSIVVAVMNEGLCKLKNISCTYTPPVGDFPEIEGDSEKIRLVVIKLIENAIAYNKEGGSVSIKLLKTADGVRFEITDIGIGIPKAEQHRVFERFFRGSNASTMQTDAFGLGLFIAKNFIEQHKGKIGFTSEEGKGSTFWFEIPLK